MRCWRRSFIAPGTARPATSPFTSARNTGTPIRLKPSARVIRVTVLPVPVAPATRPCRLPYFASRRTSPPASVVIALPTRMSCGEAWSMRSCEMRCGSPILRSALRSGLFGGSGGRVAAVSAAGYPSDTPPALHRSLRVSVLAAWRPSSRRRFRSRFPLVPARQALPRRLHAHDVRRSATATPCWPRTKKPRLPPPARAGRDQAVIEAFAKPRLLRCRMLETTPALRATPRLPRRCSRPRIDRRERPRQPPVPDSADAASRSARTAAFRRLCSSTLR